MKLTIEGSALANRMKPLATPVRQHEGRDYDKMYISITDEDGKKYLKACIDQPSYSAYMNLNLSGEQPLTQQGEEPPLGAQPIDENAVPCGAKEMFLMKASDMFNLNRNVGTYQAEYTILKTGLEVKMTESAIFRKPCKHLNERLTIPNFFDQEPSPKESLFHMNRGSPKMHQNGTKKILKHPL